MKISFDDPFALKAEALKPVTDSSLGEMLRDPIGALLKRYGIESGDTPASLSLDHLSPEHRAEILGEAYKELTSKQKTKELTSEQKTTVPSATLALVASLYHDNATRTAYMNFWKRSKHERFSLNGSLDEYKKKVNDIAKLEQEYDVVSHALFANRGTRSSAVEKLVYQRTKRLLDQKREQLATYLEAHPRLMAKASFDRINKYNQELSGTEPFMWFPSRREILETIETSALSGRPVFLMGESGTGKTALAKAAARILTGTEVFKNQGGPSTRLQDALGKRDSDERGSFITYGPLGIALTGKKTSRDTEPFCEGGMYFDDEFNNRPKDLQIEILKSVSGIRPGQSVNLPVIGSVTVAPRFLFVAAGNPGEKYGREETDVATEREYEYVQVDYPSQSLENPELFEGMLASLMDKNGRLRYDARELAPPLERNKKGEPQTRIVTGERRERLYSSDPKAGGYVWRLANALRELYTSFSRSGDTVLKHKGVGQHLERFVLDPGMMFGWLRQATEQGETGFVELFIKDHLKKRLRMARSREDAKLAKEFFEYFGLLDEDRFPFKPSPHNLTQGEIGLLSPTVKYLPSEKPSNVSTGTAIINGSLILYRCESTEDVPVGMKRVETAGGKTRTWIILGTKDQSLVLQSDDVKKEYKLLDKDTFLSWKGDAKRDAEKRGSSISLELQEEILRENRAWQRSLFGKEFPMKPFPLEATQERVNRWKEMGFTLRFLPNGPLNESDSYPGWNKKPNQGTDIFSKLTEIRNLPKNTQFKDLDPNELTGVWTLIDTRPKPEYAGGNQKYQNDTLEQILPNSSRFNIHPREFDKREFWDSIKNHLGLEGERGASVRLPRCIEQNIMGQGADFSGTDTWEWCAEWLNSARRLISGNSDSGGVSFVSSYDGALDSVGFRPLVVFSGSPLSGEAGPGSAGDLRSLELWNPERIRQEEEKKLSAFFEKAVPVPALPPECTEARIKEWADKGFALHYLPDEDMASAKNKALTAWTKKPGDGGKNYIGEAALPDDFYQLSKGWILIDTIKKPSYTGTQQYRNDPLASILPNNSRFNIHPAKFDEQPFKKKIADVLGVNQNQIELPTLLAMNILAHIHDEYKDWGNTSCAEWMKDHNKTHSASRLVSGGYGGGGVSYVYSNHDARGGVGFRPLVRLL